MSDKYEVLSPLGSGSFSTVYLVRHQILKVEQAIKVIPKTGIDQLSVLSEARLLTAIHHSGIPIIYDILEDEYNYYLVEEYIHGDSLDVFLLRQPFISRTIFFDICRQLCDIFIYLHTSLPFPILYQDLKPEHIIVCGEEIKLIDFGAANYLSSSGNKSLHYGNRDFSAPENTMADQLTVAADVFTLGKFFLYLSAYVNPPLSHPIMRIFHKATNDDPKLRYETVEELLMVIQKEFSKNNQEHLPKKYAVFGSHNGCGVTHFCISMVASLNAVGRKAFYFEKTNRPQLHSLLRFDNECWEKDGCIHKGFFQGFPDYGNGITYTYPTNAIEVYDYGTDQSPLTDQSYDQVFFLCDSASWRFMDLSNHMDFLQKYNHLSVLCLQGDVTCHKRLSSMLKLPVLEIPFDTRPFYVTPKKASYFSLLTHQKRRFFLFFYVKAKFLGLLGR